MAAGALLTAGIVISAHQVGEHSALQSGISTMEGKRSYEEVWVGNLRTDELDFIKSNPQLLRSKDQNLLDNIRTDEIEQVDVVINRREKELKKLYDKGVPLTEEKVTKKIDELSDEIETIEHDTDDKVIGIYGKNLPP